KVKYYGYSNPLSFKTSPVQQALVLSFCQNHSKAIECLLEVIADQPAPSMFVLLGKIQMKAKKTKDAVESFQQALKMLTSSAKILPNTFEAAEIYYFLGLCYMEQVSLLQTYKNAIEDLTKTIDLDKICIFAYYNRAICYHQIKDFGKVLCPFIQEHLIMQLFRNANKLFLNISSKLSFLHQQSFTTALLSVEDLSTCFVGTLGCIHDNKFTQLELYEEAVNSFTQVLKLDPFSLDAYVARGNSYMEYGHEVGNTQAQKDFLKALHLNPQCVKARICLGYNLQAFGKFQKAWNQFTVAIDIDPKCHIAYDGRAVISLQMGDTFAAFQDTNAALKFTTTAQLLTNRGVINQFMGYLNCAMKDYQQAISINPGYALAYFNAANIYFHHKQFSQANSYYSKALQLDPRNESAVLNRAITNTLLQNIEEAKEDFEKAICLCPFSAAVYFNRANLYRTLKQYELAEKDISTALSIQPNDALMYKLRADVRGKMGFSEEAIADYKQAISIQEMIDAM
uniref:Tetratricopeptide repeat domain 6 n=1 Tax=Gopherus evgoodei TaxID=1825980 RepID=A0A8C4XXS6_9SAUR